jgi:thiol-disulfide isomerase/thioredoxin
MARGERPSCGDFAPRFLRLAEANPEDFPGFDALQFIALDCESDRPEVSRAVQLLVRHHSRGNRIGGELHRFVAPRFFGTRSGEIVGLLRDVLEHNPHPDIQAEACFGLAQFLSNQAAFARQVRLPEHAGLARQVERLWGEGHLAYLKRLDVEALLAESTSLFDRGRKSYPEYWESHVCFGRVAPEIEGEDIEGRPLALGDYRGKVILLNFWGTGCLPCIAMFPHERELVRRLEGRPFALLGIANDKDRTKVERMMKDEGLTWRSWWDGEEAGYPIMSSWKVRSWPSIYLLDRRGVVRYRDLRGEELDVAVDALLAEVVEPGRSSPSQP